MCIECQKGEDIRVERAIDAEAKRWVSMSSVGIPIILNPACIGAYMIYDQETAKYSGKEINFNDIIRKRFEELKKEI